MKFTSNQLNSLEDACHSWIDQMSLTGRMYHMPIFPFLEDICEDIASKAGTKRRNLRQDNRQVCTWKMKQLEKYTVYLCNAWFPYPDDVQINSLALQYGQELPYDLLSHSGDNNISKT